MQTYLLIILGLLVIGGTYFVVENFRFIKTIFLISQTSPYTQTGTGDGRILIVGDSTGYGTGVQDSAHSIAGRIGADFPRYAIINESHNGDTIKKAMERQPLKTEQYDLILLQLGANDVLQKQPIPAILSDLGSFYTELTTHTDTIVMMSLGDIGTIPAHSGAEAAAYSKASQAYHTALEQFAAERPDFTYVNLYEDPATDPFVLEPDTHLASDGLHPTAAGYAVWYEKLRPVLQSLLAKQ